MLRLGSLLSIDFNEKPQNVRIVRVAEIRAFWWERAAEERALRKDSYCWEEREAHREDWLWFCCDLINVRSGEEGRDCWCSKMLSSEETRGRSSM